MRDSLVSGSDPPYTSSKIKKRRPKGMSVYAERVRARIAIVDQHIRSENRHDLEAVMATFGNDARYDDEPWHDHRTGRDGVRSYYIELMKALPDLEIDVKQQHCAAESVIVE